MGRFFAAAALTLMLVPASNVHVQPGEPAFFSLLFPQLIPGFMWEEPAQTLDGEAVQL